MAADAPVEAATHPQSADRRPDSLLDVDAREMTKDKRTDGLLSPASISAAKLTTGIVAVMP